MSPNHYRICPENNRLLPAILGDISNSCCRSRAEDNMRDSTDPGKNLFLEKDIFILLLHGQSAYGTVFFTSDIA